MASRPTLTGLPKIGPPTPNAPISSAPASSLTTTVKKVEAQTPKADTKAFIAKMSSALISAVVPHETAHKTADLALTANTPLASAEGAKKSKKQRSQTKTLSVAAATPLHTVQPAPLKAFLSAHLPSQKPLWTEKIVALIHSYTLPWTPPFAKSFSPEQQAILQTIHENWAFIARALPRFSYMQAFGIEIVSCFNQLTPKPDWAGRFAYGLLGCWLFIVAAAHRSTLQQIHQTSLPVALADTIESHRQLIQPCYYQKLIDAEAARLKRIPSAARKFLQQVKQLQLIPKLELLWKLYSDKTLCTYLFREMRKREGTAEEFVTFDATQSQEERLQALIQALEFLALSFNPTSSKTLLHGLIPALQNVQRTPTDEATKCALHRKLASAVKDAGLAITCATMKIGELVAQPSSPEREKALFETLNADTYAFEQQAWFTEFLTSAEQLLSTPSYQELFRRFSYNLSFIYAWKTEKKLLVSAFLKETLLSADMETFIALLYQAAVIQQNEVTSTPLAFSSLFPILGTYLPPLLKRLKITLSLLKSNKEKELPLWKKRVADKTATELQQNRQAIIAEIQTAWLQENELLIRLCLLLKDAEHILTGFHPEKVNEYLMPLELAEFLDIEEELETLIDEQLSTPLPPASLTPAPTPQTTTSKPSLPKPIHKKKAQKFEKIQGSDKRRIVLEKLAAIGFFEVSGGRHPHVMNTQGVRFPVPQNINYGIANSLNRMIASVVDQKI